MWKLVIFLGIICRCTSKPIVPKSLPKTRTIQQHTEPWELNRNLGLNLFEGDITKHPGILQSNTRNAMKNADHLWKNNEIPYVLEGPYSHEERMLFMHALAEFGAKTCNKFRQKVASDLNYVAVIRGSGCYSSVGMDGGRQELSIGNGCLYKGTIQHEAMHTVGFWHEQSRYDRDDFVEIVWDNIVEGQEYNFNKYSNETITTLGMDYEYQSIMHYGSRSFSKNGEDTIILSPSRQGTGEKVQIGQRDHLTDLDIAKQRKLYNCDNSLFVGWSEWSDWSECDTECVQLRWRWCNSDSCDGDSEQSQTCSDCEVGFDPDCGTSDFYGKVGTISSPMYPNNYKNYADCKFTIHAENSDHPLFVKFVRLGIEYEPICGYDFLRIYENGQNEAVAHLCGSELPPDHTYQVETLELMFHSDSSTTDIGYKILYFNAPVIQLWPFEQPIETSGWTQGQDDDFDWTRGSGKTPSPNTGPNNDHTINDQIGHYMFIETSSPQYGPMHASLYSPIVAAISGEGCLQFNYHMFGEYMGTLNVYLIEHEDDGSSKTSQILSADGNKGNVWLTHRIPPPTETKFQIKFEAIRGGGYLSDIAIDDVAIFGVNCEEM